MRTIRRNSHLVLVTTFLERRLPHFYSEHEPMFLTWRLHGSLPNCRHFPVHLSSGEAFLAMDRLLENTRTGAFFLRIPEVAKLVVEAIRYRDLQAYRLHAFTIMPNHVHLLMTPLAPVSKVMHSLKRITAWQAESYDRLVRNGLAIGRQGSHLPHI